MPRKKIAWFPLKGIDAHQTTVYGTEVQHAVDALNVTMYDTETIEKRSSLVAISTNESYDEEIYDVVESEQGRYVVADGGIWRGTTNVWERAEGEAVEDEMALWYERGFTPGLVLTEDDEATKFGLLPPTEDAFSSITWEIGDTEILDIDGTRFYQGVPQFPYVNQPDDATWNSDTGHVSCNSAAFALEVFKDDYVLLATEDPIDWDNAWVGKVTSLTGPASRGVAIWEATNLTEASPESGDYKIWWGPIKFASVAQMKLSPVYLGQFGFRFVNTVSGSVSNMLIVECTEDANIPVGMSAGTLLRFDTESGESDDVEVQMFRLDIDIATAQIYRDTLKRFEANEQHLTWTQKERFEDDADIWSRNGNYPPVTVDDDDESVQVRLHHLGFYGGRLWGAWNNRLYYSQAFDKVNSFEYFGLAGLNYQEFPDTIRSVVFSETSIHVFLEFSVWVMYGMDPTSMTVREATSEIGMNYTNGATRYKDKLWLVGSDDKVYVMGGMNYEEVVKMSSCMDLWAGGDSLSKLLGSNNSLWFNFSEHVGRYDFAHQAIWRYYLHVDDPTHTTRMFPGTSTTYVACKNTLYALEGTASGDTGEVMDCHITSPKILLSPEASTRGQINRVLVKGLFTDATLEILVDGVVERTLTFSSTGETVNLHFKPVWAYFIQVKISKKSIPAGEQFKLTAPLLINPW